MKEKNIYVNNKSINNEYVGGWYCWNATVQVTCALSAKYYELFTDTAPY